MAAEPFTYQEEKEGKVAEYIALHPVHHRRNYPERVEILTGEHIPVETVVDETV